ncbi:heme-degrading monooxygenase HmoA [Rheinheimera pacifica]|uniref:antibiotic biosynthesis monooxygenase family protein n=1 Tax=Rheinheimera pacifica TaxID=173990 RepID=UPI002856D52C|nr:antibiotic biosynthesis monooxygenase [Rheinheimera pacifica]MDR6984185.1 heme-degrading monooxygenase HmoA [Rheinheimera pacifica]
MIAVIFEVTPTTAGKDSYFAIAAQLAPMLSTIDGFISVERFESLTNPGTFLSLSFWRDESAVLQWRQQLQHQAAQQKGRNGLFANYRLRVANVVRDYGLNERQQAPEFISL